MVNKKLSECILDACFWGGNLGAVIFLIWVFAAITATGKFYGIEPNNFILIMELIGAISLFFLDLFYFKKYLDILSNERREKSDEL